MTATGLVRPPQRSRASSRLPDPSVPVRASALYEGTVRHRRFGPVPHAFERSTAMALLDLDELEPLLDALPLWSRRRWTPVRFRRRDYLDGGDTPLAEALGDLVESRVGRRPRGPVRMLTHLRTWGWLFNPITVYWCFEPDGITPDLVVLEVTNTPWKERDWYVVPAEQVSGRGAVFPKTLAVSPFLDQALDYRLSCDTPGGPAALAPGAPLDVRIEVLRRGRKVFDADLWLTRTELDARRAVGAALRRPLETVRVSLGIHLEAARLWRKGVPVVPHPRRPSVPASVSIAPTDTMDAGTEADRRGAAAIGVVDRVARAALWRLLGRAGSGRVELTEDGGAVCGFGPGRPDRHGRPSLTARVQVHDARTYRAVLTGGSVGLGEAYLQGWWDVDDLPAFLRLLSREVHRYDPARNGVAHTVGAVADRLRARRAQDKHRDRANIAAHYDLGNDFFSLMLDETMMYSSAVFATPQTPLVEASTHKLDLMCRRLQLGPGDHVVEIGSGWGGFAVHAAARYGCRVTTTTISRAQFDHTTARVAEAGLARRVEVRHDDYRDLTGRYDKLVSIEMIEAVDWRELDTFFAACQRLLTPGGVMGLQAIVIPAQRYERAKNTQDFIKAFIFPGGCLPSIESICRSSARVTDFTLTDLEAFGPHYAETLRRWRANVHAHAGDLDRLGLDDRFRRMWDFYLAYCEAAFDEGAIDVVQCVLARPGHRRSS